LTALDVQSNQIEGSIPTTLGDTRNLRVIGLHQNKLRGSIPTEIGLLQNLEEINFGSNRLVGPLPSVLGNVATLRQIAVGFNPGITGILPTEWGQLERLESLAISLIRLETQTIPEAYWGLTKLSTLEGLSLAPSSCGHLLSTWLTLLQLTHPSLVRVSSVPLQHSYRSMRLTSLGHCPR